MIQDPCSSRVPILAQTTQTSLLFLSSQGLDWDGTSHVSEGAQELHFEKRVQVKRPMDPRGNGSGSGEHGKGQKKDRERGWMPSTGQALT